LIPHIKKVSLSNPSKIRAAPTIIDVLVDHGQAMLGGILPEHHALCLDASAFALKLIVTAQSQIKCGVINRCIVWLFHVKSSLKRNKDTSDIRSQLPGSSACSYDSISGTIRYK